MMTKEILWAIDKIKDINNDPQTSMQYYTNDCSNRHIGSHAPDDIRYRLLCYLFEQTHRVDIIVELGALYTNNQHYCWPSHAHHFHPTFEQYVNCPITCLAEIEEYLESMAYKVLGA